MCNRDEPPLPVISEFICDECKEWIAEGDYVFYVENEGTYPHNLISGSLPYHRDCMKYRED